MRRLAIVLLTCLGLTLTLSGVADAAKVKTPPLTALSFTSVQVVPGADADHCYVDLTWTPAPAAAPKGYTFEGYRVPVSSDPNPDWISLSAYTFDQPQGRVSVVFPLPNDGSTLYFNVTAVWYKTKGKFALTNTPFGVATPVVLSC
jgi:hypothetical protein